MKTTPRIFVNKKAGSNGILTIVYHDRVEDYEFKSSQSKTVIERQNDAEWNFAQEIDVLKQNGFKEVHPATGDM
mgnify:CR=1 FL=1